MQIIKVSDKKVIFVAKTIIKKGGVVICPTDTVYGFLADACNKKAVEKIFRIKKRPKVKPLAVFVKDIKMAKELAEISEDQEKILTLRLHSGQAKYWPGKYTFVFKRKKLIDLGSRTIRTKLYGVDKKTIALRIPKHKFLQGLLKKINKPLAQTSVNISGEPPFTKISDIIEKFGTSNITMLIINAGNLPKNQPSKIIDLTGKVLTWLR